MRLTKFEKTVLVGSPWLFGTVLIVAQIFGAMRGMDKVYSLILGSCGLILIALYCVCALLVKIVEK